MAAPHLSASDDIASAKRAMRKAALRVRATCDPALGRRIVSHVLAECSPAAGSVVAGFWPLGGEIDTRPLLVALHTLGHVVVLPATPQRGAALTFREWAPGACMTREAFGTMRPDGPERRPDWLLVPLLAFDRAGRRLGYGGGFYDRTLAALSEAVAVGCAFAAQEVAEVPAEPHDIHLRAVVTERGLVRCEP